MSMVDKVKEKASQATDKVKGKVATTVAKEKEKNSWENRYARLKDSQTNKKARKGYEKAIAATYAEQVLTEEQEAILFSQEFHRLQLKNPAGAKFPGFDEYEITKTENTYIIKGSVDSTNSYGAVVREAYELEVCKKEDEWSCITDVGANALRTLILWLFILALPTIIASCSISNMM